MKGLWTKLGVATVGASALTLVTGGLIPAYASTNTNTPSSKIVVTAPLRVVSDSSNVATNNISPDNTVKGDCGTAYMSIGNAGSGYADIVLGASSTKGAIVFETNSWTGSAPVGSISGSGHGWPFSGSFSYTYHRHVGHGAVAAAGSISVTTDEGAVCQSYPLAGKTIT